MKLNVITYPEFSSEFDIQAETYMAIKQAGYKVHGEVRAICEDFGKRHKCRLDLVVFDPYDRPVLIIECKDSDNGSYALDEGTRQHRRYHKFNLPVLRVGSLEQIPRVLRVLDDNEEI